MYVSRSHTCAKNKNFTMAKLIAFLPKNVHQQKPALILMINKIQKSSQVWGSRAHSTDANSVQPARTRGTTRFTTRESINYISPNFNSQRIVVISASPDGHCDPAGYSRDYTRERTQHIPKHLKVQNLRPILQHQHQLSGGGGTRHKVLHQSCCLPKSCTARLMIGPSSSARAAQKHTGACSSTGCQHFGARRAGRPGTPGPRSSRECSVKM
jgi:hypothetical protein